MKWIFSLALLGILSCQQKPKSPSMSEDKLEVETIMANQQKAWNEGSLENFMIPYIKSDSLVFIGSRGLNYGWEQTLSNYKKSYSSKDKMGRLLFENEKIENLGNSGMWIAGRWNLFRDHDTLRGSYLLVWKKINGEWKIVADHSS
tara:strand:- start:3400 stop:3837 length:438 start_codon:yes stop_codon:yes gene_type:complete